MPPPFLPSLLRPVLSSILFFLVVWLVCSRLSSSPSSSASTPSTSSNTDFTLFLFDDIAATGCGLLLRQTSFPSSSLLHYLPVLFVKPNSHSLSQPAFSGSSPWSTPVADPNHPLPPSPQRITLMSSSPPLAHSERSVRSGRDCSLNRSSSAASTSTSTAAVRS